MMKAVEGLADAYIARHNVSSSQVGIGRVSV